MRTTASGAAGRTLTTAAIARRKTRSGNDLVTGNVTGGRHFRGPIDYTDPGAFRGRTAGVSMDSFLRQSSGPTKDSRLADTEQRYYGDGRAAPPPPNFVQVGGIGSGSYVPAGPAVNRSLSDQRVGAVDFTQPYVLPAPGQLLLPGPIDPSAGQQYITASPLTGIRQINANDPNFFNSVTHTQYNPVTGRLDDNAIQKMRDELNAAADAGESRRCARRSIARWPIRIFLAAARARTQARSRFCRPGRARFASSRSRSFRPTPAPCRSSRSRSTSRSCAIRINWRPGRASAIA